MVIKLIKGISVVPIKHTRWELKALYNNTRTHTYMYARKHTCTHTHTHLHALVHAHTHTHTHAYTHTHTHTHMHTHTHTCIHAHTHACMHSRVSDQGDRHSCEKDSLEVVTEQVSVEGGFERGRRIRV